MQGQDSCFKDVVGKKVKVVYNDIGKDEVPLTKAINIDGKILAKI